MVESSDQSWSTGKGNGKSLQYFSLENPMNSMKRQKDIILKDELPSLLLLLLSHFSRVQLCVTHQAPSGSPPPSSILGIIQAERFLIYYWRSVEK